MSGAPIRTPRILDRRSFRLIPILLIAAFSWQWAMAERAVPQAQRIIHESWTFKEGAPVAVWALAQTADDYLWLGTAAGLYRFDGIRFELFRSPFGDQLLTNNIAWLFAPPTGGLWVGNVTGGVSFVRNGRVTNYPEVPGTVYSFAQDRQGIVWAATDGGLWRFDGSTWQHVGAEWNAPQKPVSQVGFDREGILWVLTESRDFKVAKQLYFLSPGDRQFRKAGDDLFVQGFTLDADNRVLTTHERRPREPNSGVELESSLPAYPILKKNTEQILDRANGIWFLSIDPLIFRHAGGDPLADIVSKASSGDSQVYDINAYRYARLVDREGGVWIGDSTGVHRFSYSPLMQPQFSKVRTRFTVAPDDSGVVWINAGDGTGSSDLYRVADGKVEFKGALGGLTNFAYRAPDRTFWFGGEGGLWHMANGSLTRIELPKEMGKPWLLTTVTQDGSGGMWVAFGRTGLYRLKDGVWTKYGGRSDFPSSGAVIVFTDTLGRIWFGCAKSQLAVLDGDRIQTFGPNDGLQVGSRITAVSGRGSEVWIGGELGLQQFDHGRFHTIHALDQQSLRGISGIVETANGDLWLNGLGGIVHLRRAEIMEALKNPSYQVSGERFDRRAGLPGLPSPALPTAVEGTDGRLWFTANNGVVWLDPTRASNNSPPPPVSIQSFSADDKAYALGQPLRLPARTSNVKISYAAVSLLNPEAIRFRYKLRETDKDWHDVGTSTSVSYRNLLPGSYHFVVSASDTNGLWSDHTATVEFTILPAFYQTNWFRALCAIFLLAVLWAGYQWRVRQLQHQFDMTFEARVSERTRIARDLHDTLLQSFHGLLLRFQTVFQLLPERPMEAKEKLESAIEQAAEAITEGRDAVQGLRASTVERNDLALAIRTLGEELENDSSNRRPATFLVSVEGQARDLHPILRDEIYKIAAEALRNAFHHAQANQVEVEIRYDNEQFQLRVRDDGKGIDPAILSSQSSKGHYGLPGMRERATIIGGKLIVWSEVDAGTEVELRVPASAAYMADRKPSWWLRKFAPKA
jgi:signal transduction histidine kinase/ligand-binding sensor domain-containing protein